MNREVYWDLLKESNKETIDQNKWIVREQEMIVHRREQLLTEGKTVVLTGTGHLQAFKQAFPMAEIPLNF